MDALGEDDDSVTLNAWGATVLMRISVPHVHVHVLVPTEEARRLGYTYHEFACHACGSSVVMASDWVDVASGTADSDVMRERFRTFWDDHVECLVGRDRDVITHGAMSFLLGSTRDLAAFCPGVSRGREVEFTDLRGREWPTN